MKKLILTIILGAVSFFSCSFETPESPAIKMESCTVNGESVSLPLPSVKAGDVVELTLDLEGNGSELQTFQADADAEDVKMSLTEYDKSRVSDDKNFTKIDECLLRFVDGVTISSVKVKATVQQKNDDKMCMKFYLSAKSASEGTALEIDMNRDNIKN